VPAENTTNISLFRKTWSVPVFTVFNPAKYVLTCRAIRKSFGNMSYYPCIGARGVNRALFSTAIVALALFFLVGCTIKHAAVSPGTIPFQPLPTPKEQQVGERFYKKLSKDYSPLISGERYEQLTVIFDRLARAAGVQDLPWHLCLFVDPEVINIRAVSGNYLFVWTGLLDLLENEDEIAALLATELGHALAFHTAPVEYTLGAELLFGVTDITLSVAAIVLSQGVLAVGGSGMTRWAYTEMANLDPLDRCYSENQELEAAAIALLILDRAGYAPRSMTEFWQRVDADKQLRLDTKSLSRKFSSSERVVLLQTLLPQPFEWQQKDLKQWRKAIDAGAARPGNATFAGSEESRDRIRNSPDWKRHLMRRKEWVIGNQSHAEGLVVPPAIHRKLTTPLTPYPSLTTGQPLTPR